MPARTLRVSLMPVLFADGIIVTWRTIFGVNLFSDLCINMVVAALTVLEVNRLAGGIIDVSVGKVIDVAPGVTGVDSNTWTTPNVLEFIPMLGSSEEALRWGWEPCSC